MLHKIICQAPGCRNMIYSKTPFTEEDLYQPITCDDCQDWLANIMREHKLKQERKNNGKTITGKPTTSNSKRKWA